MQSYTKIKAANKPFFFILFDPIIFLSIGGYSGKKKNIMYLETKTYNPTQSIRATIQEMLLLEKESRENHFFKNWVLQTFKNNGSVESLYKKIHEYVSKNFTYRDESEIEIITSPKQMIISKTGDCDDFSLFIKAALDVFGINTNFYLAGKENEDFCHVLVITPEGFLIDGTNDKFNFLDKNIYKQTAIVEEY